MALNILRLEAVKIAQALETSNDLNNLLLNADEIYRFITTGVKIINVVA